MDLPTYTVTLQFSGGQSPYTVSGATGTLSGTTFTSNPIAVNTQTTIFVTRHQRLSGIVLQYRRNLYSAYRLRSGLFCCQLGYKRQF